MSLIACYRWEHWGLGREVTCPGLCSFELRTSHSKSSGISTIPGTPCQVSPATGAGLEVIVMVVVMAKALIASEILCTFASCVGSVHGNDCHLGVCFVFQSWGSEIHVSHTDEVGQFLQTSLLLWPTSLTCLVPKMPLPKSLWLLSVCMSFCTPEFYLFLNAVFFVL